MEIKHSKIGCLKSLKINNHDNVIAQPWGAEIGNWNIFWSHYLHQKKVFLSQKKNSLTNRFYISSFDISAIQKETWNERKIKREYTFRLNRERMIGDVVNRLTFKKKFFDYVLIEGEKIFHHDKNKYYQYKTDEVKLINDYYSILIKAKGLISPSISKKFDFVMYVRDEPSGTWVVHARFIAKYPGDEVICRCRPSNFRIPSFLFGKRFYLAREKNPKVPINCGVNVKCKKDDWFKIRVEVKVNG